MLAVKGSAILDSDAEEDDEDDDEVDARERASTLASGADNESTVSAIARMAKRLYGPGAIASVWAIRCKKVTITNRYAPSCGGKLSLFCFSGGRFVGG